MTNIALQTLKTKRVEILKELRVLKASLKQINDAISKLHDESGEFLAKLPISQKIEYKRNG
jgi:uncharacterized coiled-coil DUF342 family protein